jgi:uncharacterized protein (TIGR02147 family)
MKNIFEFKRYKPFLRDQLGKTGARTGRKSAFAKAIGCHTAYVSKVLNGDADFSSEQGLSAAQFLELGEEETQYFLLLLQKARAGTRDLKLYTQKQIIQLLERRQNIKRRLQIKQSVSAEAQNRYYSSWHYIAIHMSLTIKRYQTPKAISDYLKIDLHKVDSVLEFLLENGLASLENGLYKVGPTQIHLGKESSNIYKHHTNWRMRATHALDNISRDDNLHYSVVYTLSKRDALILKERLVEVIKQNIETIVPSPEEATFCNTIDFFELGDSK